jgi:PAS domain S-box-containing protein
MAGKDIPENAGTKEGKLHVLILECEDMYAGHIGRRLGRTVDEYRVTLARTLKEAREVLERDPPDLIIADWLLPDGRGIDILPCRDGRVTTPLIIMTRHGDAKLAVQLMKSGAIDYILKSELTYSDLPHIAGRALREWENIQKRKRAEGMARESRKRLSDIISFLPDATLAIDNEGKVIAWNHAIEQMTGVCAEDMIGKGDHEYSIPFYGERRPVLIDLVLADDPEIEKKYYFTRRDGERITSEAFIPALNNGRGAFLWGTAVPLYDTDGNRVGAIESIRDITDRKRVELALQESEKKYRFLVDNVRDIIWQATPDLTITYLSPAAERLTGYSVGELTGKSVFSLLTERSAAEVRDCLKERLEENARGRPVSATVFEIEMEKRDGTLLRVEVSSSPVFTADGKFTGFSGISRDITERRQAEAALKESEIRFRDLFNNMSSGVAIYEAVSGGDDFIIRNINRAVETIEHVKKEEVVGHRLREIFPGVEALGLLDVLRRVWKSGAAEHHPVSLYRDNRISGWRENYVYRLASGEVVAIYDDVTEKKQAEEALRESEEKFRRIFNSANDGIILVDINPSGLPGRIRDVNAIQCTRLGYSAKDLQQKMFSDILTQESREKIPAFIAGLLFDGQAVFEAVFRTKDGGLLETEMSSHIISFRNKDILIGIARDITLRKKEEQALRLANQKLQLMNIVAWHNIQNKITGLRGYVELIRDLVRDDRAQQFLRQEDEILTTIHNYIQYTKEYQEMGTLPMQWVNIPAVIASVLALTDKKGIAVSVELGDLYLYCDPVIERVFSHLVENTIAHGGKATMIRIWCEESAAGLTLIYTDDGVGIPADHKESIFVRDVAKGSGFSLYFIHDILELSGMGIRESGEPGKGVRFEISVPKGSYRTDVKKDTGPALGT